MIRVATAPILAVPVALVVAACGGDGDDAPAPLTTGIEGRVLIGPQCPVVREDTPCPDAPYAADIEVWDAERTQLVTTFATDEKDGLFRVELPPGDYYLDPQEPREGVLPIAEGRVVTVPEEGFTEVTITYESGIR